MVQCIASTSRVAGTCVSEACLPADFVHTHSEFLPHDGLDFPWMTSPAPAPLFRAKLHVSDSKPPGGPKAD